MRDDATPVRNKSRGQFVDINNDSFPSRHNETPQVMPGKTLTDTETALKNTPEAVRTGYRVFMLLRWLMESPQTVKGLQDKFAAHPEVQHRLSADTLGLYLNTLKLLGCKISRPSPRNSFSYELVAHPFAKPFSPEAFEAVVTLLVEAGRSLHWQDIVQLQRFFGRLLDGLHQPHQQFDTVLTQARMVDYRTLIIDLDELAEYAEQKTPLRVDYQSPLDDRLSQFAFVPDSLQFHKGVLYLKGYRENGKSGGRLRVERILHTEPLRGDGQAPLTPPEASYLSVIVWASANHFQAVLEALNPYLVQYVPFDQHPSPPAGYGATGLQLTLSCDDIFELEQLLLGLGLPFSLSENACNLEQTLSQTLRQMLQLYDGKAAD